mgnify:CR=1 FL=1
MREYVPLYQITIRKMPAVTRVGDADGDNFVNLNDLFLVLDNWLETTVPGESGDVNQDEIVNLSDLFDVLDNWLQ